MKRLIILVLPLLVSCAAQRDNDVCWGIIKPPQEYLNHKYETRTIWLHQKFIRNYCNKLGVNTHADACTGRDDIGWFNVLPDDGNIERLSCAIQHETAHVGPHPWPWDHPTGE